MLNQVVHAVSAALLTGDPRPIVETSDWIGELMPSRGVGLSQVYELGELLAATLHAYAQAGGLVERHFGVGLDAR